jgi:hypothetical protein
VIHEAPDKLHREIFERERGPMKELKYEVARAQLDEGRDRWMPKISVRLTRHAGEVVIGDGFADERPHYRGRHFGIGSSRKTRDSVGIKSRPGRRHIKAAVAGKTGERRFHEAERGGLAPGGHVAHASRGSS